MSGPGTECSLFTRAARVVGPAMEQIRRRLGGHLHRAISIARSNLQRGFRGRRPYDLENRLQRDVGGGGSRTRHPYVSPCGGFEGSRHLHDITEHREALEQLRESRARSISCPNRGRS